MKRNVNLDLIRSTAILAVLCQHFLTGSGVYAMDICGISGFVMSSLRVIFMCSVPLFLMLSGYLCNKKQLNFKYYLGIVKIYVVYLLVCVACLIFKALYMKQEMDLRYIFGSIFNHYAIDYSWYVVLYTGLFLLIPFLNILYNNLPGRRHKQILIITLIYLTVIPTICNIFVQIYTTWWTNLYPLVYYFTGAYIKEYQPKLSIKKGLLILGLLVILFGGMNYWLSYSRPFVWASYNYYDGFQVVAVSFLIFLVLANIDLSTCSKKLAVCTEILSRHSFNIYLVSYITDTVIYDILRANVASLPARLWFLPLTVTVSLLFSLLFSWLLNFPAKAIEKGICAWLLKLKDKLCSKCEKVCS